MRVTWLFLITAVAGCSAPKQPDASQQYTGYFLSGFESSSFHPVGQKERWWLKGSIPCRGLNVGPDVSGFPSASWVHISVYGTVSEQGQYGHLGAYDRELTVQSVLSCRSLLPGERVEP